jgi:hypothetical protein
MTEPTQSVSVQPGILHTQRDDIAETGLQDIGSVQTDGAAVLVAVAVATGIIVEVAEGATEVGIAVDVGDAVLVPISGMEV